ncbi:MAG: biotin--[acetyl-CoA-carboxylase] ligase [Hyphomonadaceae bacterium]|nr:biotin--[acetyl-CoA-carboxylase] ligase [Hyphomonadaceae bacterium]
MSQPLAIQWHDEIDSTNEAAKRIAQAGPFTPHWIAARRQTAGRGRLGRGWVSPEGNLFTTALLPVPGGVADALRLPFAAALAVYDLIAHYAGSQLGLGLKWPNDVRHEGRKLSGILVESGQGPQGHWAAVGMGVNLAHVPQGLDQPAACLAELMQGRPVPAPEDALKVLATRFALRCEEAWEDFEATRAAWCHRVENRDGQIRARVQDEVVEGLFDGLDTDGGLILRLPSGVRRTIRAGDVELVRRV